MPLLPVIGQTVNGARLWVHFGSLQFQPGELGKIALIVFLAAYLREKREVLAQGRLKDWGPLLVIWGAAMMVLFVTDDLGSALLFYGIFLGMLYVATERYQITDVSIIEPNMMMGLELMKTDRYAKNGIGWMEEKKMCDSVDLVNTYMGLPKKVECKDVYSTDFLTKVEVPK